MLKSIKTKTSASNMCVCVREHNRRISMNPTIHNLPANEWTEFRVVLAIILWQPVAAFIIAFRDRVQTIQGILNPSHDLHLNLFGLWLWNMVLLSAVDMLVLPPIFAFTHYYYHYQ